MSEDTTILKNMLATMRDSRDAQREVLETLRQVRDYQSHAGKSDATFMETQGGGLETPLMMADISCKLPIDLVGRGPTYAGVDLSDDIHHFSGGEVIITAIGNKPAGLLFYAAEAQVTAYVANQPNVLATAPIPIGGELLVAIPLNQAYTRISLGVRQLVNGLPSSASPRDTPAMVGAVLSVSYSGRLYR